MDNEICADNPALYTCMNDSMVSEAEAAAQLHVRWSLAQAADGQNCEELISN